MFRRNWLSTSIIIIFIAYVIVVLGTWLWSAAMPSSSVRPLLSDAGIRWFFGTFVANLARPLLIYIILLDIAMGLCIRSGLGHALSSLFRKGALLDSLQKRGMWAVLEVTVVEVGVMALLTLPRHAILLSVTGAFYPSSASVSLIPVLAFMLLSASLMFGLFSGTLHNYKEAVIYTLHGGKHLKVILCFYVLLMELAAIIKYALL
jgi:hypothetical protein